MKSAASIDRVCVTIRLMLTTIANRLAGWQTKVNLSLIPRRSEKSEVNQVNQSHRADCDDNQTAKMNS